MVKYVVQTEGIKRSNVSITCRLGNYTFEDGEILTDGNIPELKELARLFPKLFLEINTVKTVVEEVKVEKVDDEQKEEKVEDVAEQKVEDVVETSEEVEEKEIVEPELVEPEVEATEVVEENIEPVKQRGRPKKN